KDRGPDGRQVFPGHRHGRSGPHLSGDRPPGDNENGPHGPDRLSGVVPAAADPGRVAAAGGAGAGSHAAAARTVRPGSRNWLARPTAGGPWNPKRIMHYAYPNLIWLSILAAVGAGLAVCALWRRRRAWRRLAGLGRAVRCSL